MVIVGPACAPPLCRLVHSVALVADLNQGQGLSPISVNYCDIMARLILIIQDR